MNFEKAKKYIIYNSMQCNQLDVPVPVPVPVTFTFTDKLSKSTFFVKTDESNLPLAIKTKLINLAEKFNLNHNYEEMSI